MFPPFCKPHWSNFFTVQKTQKSHFGIPICHFVTATNVFVYESLSILFSIVCLFYAVSSMCIYIYKTCWDISCFISLLHIFYLIIIHSICTCFSFFLLGGVSHEVCYNPLACEMRIGNFTVIFIGVIFNMKKKKKTNLLDIMCMLHKLAFPYIY